jgi:multiple sugar transport system substrate-binding protein
MDGDVIFGYYRTDALEDPEYQAQFEEEYGYPLAPPATWDQYRDIAEFFTGWDWAGSGEPGWGVLEAQGAKDVGPFILTSRAASYAAHPDIPGSLFFDPETMEPQVGNPGWVQGLNDWIEIRQFGPPEMANYGGGDMRGNFVAGDYALGIDWADVGIIAQDETASTSKGKLGYFVLPGSSEVWNLQTGEWDSFDSPSQAPYLGWGGWHGSVAANTDVPEASWDLLNYIDSTDNAFRAVTTPGTARNPYRTDHFSDPAAWEQAPVAYADPAPYLETQSEAMNHPNTQFDLRIPRAGRYFDVLDNWAQQALGGGMSAEEALASAAAEWQQITADEGVEDQRTAYRDLYGLE